MTQHTAYSKSPRARLYYTAGGKLGYHDHDAVDGGKAWIIVGVLVTPADLQDKQTLLDLLDRAR